MHRLEDFIIDFSTRNANTYITKEEIDKNFVFPKEYSIFDKFRNLYETIKRFDNTLIFGARGVGKTLYLKKVKYDYLDEDESGIFPIYIDLTPSRDLFKTINSLKVSHHIKKQVLESELIFFMISEILKFYRDIYVNGKLKLVKILGNKVRKFIDELFGLPDEEEVGIDDELEKIRAKIANPFELTAMTSKGIVFTESLQKLIDESNELKNILNMSFLELLQILGSKMKMSKFLIIFDEFSMLSEELQNILAPIIINMSEANYKSIKIKFKISVMEGRYLVNSQDHNFIEHGFGECHFEIQFKDVFSGQNADAKLLIFYKEILKQRSKEIYDIFKDSIPFRNLCYFSGFKVRDFLRFMHDICESNKSKEFITERMVYDICVPFFRKQIFLLKQSIEPEMILKYLQSLSSELKDSKNIFYFISGDFNKNYFQIMIYYKILSFVSYSRRSSSNKEWRDSRGFLIDFSTALSFNILNRNDIKKRDLKYLNFTDAIIFNSQVISSETKDIVKNLINLNTLTNELICQTTNISLETLNLIKGDLAFNKAYDSEMLIDQDNQVKEDKAYQKMIEEIQGLSFIGEILAIDLVNLGVSKVFFLKWNNKDLMDYKKLIKQNYKSTLTRAFNNR